MPCEHGKSTDRLRIHTGAAIVVFDVDAGRFVDVNDNACRFFKMSRAALLGSGPDKISPAYRDGSSRPVCRSRLEDDSLRSGDVVFDNV